MIVMDTYEVRYCELRADSDGRILHGTIVRYSDVASIGGVFKERILPGAITVREDAILNVQHVRALPLSRLGKGMEIRDTPEAMTIRAELPKTTIADDALANVHAGNLNGFSIEMMVNEDRWEQGSMSLRTVHRAQLVGVALVDRPSYPQSSVEARARALVARFPNLGYYL